MMLGYRRKTFRKMIDAKLVSFQCMDYLANQAEFFFGLIEAEQKDKSILLDGCKVQIGWAFYIVKEQDGEFKILAPDYERNPFKDTTPDLSISLIVQIQQNDLLKKANVKGETVSFQDTILVHKDALSADSLYSVRIKSCKAGNSGWYLGLVKDATKYRTFADYQILYVYELLAAKPQVLQLLALPAGCMAIMHGNRIEEIVDVDNRRII